VRAPLGYRLVRHLARILLGLFYRRIEVVAPERLPASGPVILAANHHNALVDPLVLLVAVPRRLRPVAKAPLFHYPLIGWLVRLAGAIPVHRRQDPGGDPDRNVAMFREARAVLAEGGAILIFPEGISQAEQGLMPLRTGAARLLLDAESAGVPLGIRLVPIGLVFHDPGTFRTGSALVVVGEPVPAEDLIALARTEPEQAARRLTDRLAQALRALIVDAEDRRVLRLLAIAEAIQREESGRPAHALARATWLQAAARAYWYWRARDPRRTEHLMAEVERYAKDLELAGVTGRELSRAYPANAAWRYAVREAGSLLLGLPLALWGLANHVVPYQLTGQVVRRLRPPPDSEATFKLIAGLGVYPVCWLAEGWVAVRLGGAWGLGLFVASLVPTGFFALTWWERLARFRRDARGFWHFVRRRDLRERFLARRRALAGELAALSREVPDSVLGGAADDARCGGTPRVSREP
jgi:1-acyl-sn-glycerol-3-phosphate acyltransferase